MTNAGYASAGASVVNSLMGAYLGGKAIDAQLDATLANIKGNKENFFRESETSREQLDAINRELGDVMSARGLQALQAEARLRTAGASSGLEGASINEVVGQSKYDELFDNQVSISRARTAKTSVQRQLVSSWLNMKSINEQEASVFDSNVSPLAGALIAGLGSATNFAASNAKEFNYQQGTNPSTTDGLWAGNQTTNTGSSGALNFMGDGGIK